MFNEIKLLLFTKYIDTTNKKILYRCILNCSFIRIKKKLKKKEKKTFFCLER